MANSDLLPAIGGVILPLLGRPMKIRKNSDDCLRVLHVHFQLLERHLLQQQQQQQQSNKYYLLGDRVTLADLFVVGTLVFAVMVLHRMLEAEYPCLMGWFHDVFEMPLFKNVAGDLHLLDVPGVSTLSVTG